MINRSHSERDVISILLVDDSPEARENIKKLLAFEEQEFKVVGSVGTGTEALRAALEMRPDIVIMDVNMPDMNGIEATSEITKLLPATGVIMMSVQADADYLRRAMQAGARQYLSKPVDTDELYGTIRSVYRSLEPMRAQPAVAAGLPLDSQRPRTVYVGEDPIIRAGHVIVVYSPQGGVGCTTIATNLASGLMKRGIRVLLIDADMQFGDVGVFLKLQSQSTLRDLVEKVEDLDTDFFDSIVSTHESGLKVLLGPQRLEDALEIEVQGAKAVAQIIEKVAHSYDFIVVDTASRFDETLLSLTDIAAKIILVATPTLASVKNTRFVLEIFDKMNYPPERTSLILNRVEDERNRNRVTIPSEAIEKHLKRKIEAKIPYNEAVILTAINKGVPVVASQRDRSRSPVKELIDLSEHIYAELMNDASAADASEDGKNRPKAGVGVLRFGRS